MRIGSWILDLDHGYRSLKYLQSVKQIVELLLQHRQQIGYINHELIECYDVVSPAFWSRLPQLELAPQAAFSWVIFCSLGSLLEKFRESPQDRFPTFTTQYELFMTGRPAEFPADLDQFFFCSDLFEWRNSQVGCSLTLKSKCHVGQL